MPAALQLPALAASSVLACDVHASGVSCLINSAYLAANPTVFASLIAVSGTLTVGLLTLGGVGLTLRFNRQKMIADLQAAERAAAAARDFSAEQARQSHLMDLRKALYATLVEEHQKAVAVLFGLSNLSLLEASAAPEKLHPYASAVQKTMIISGGQTSKLAREVHAKVMEAIFDVFPLIVPLSAYKEKLEKVNAELKEQKDSGRALLERAQSTPKTDVDALKELALLAQAAQAANQATLATRNELAVERDKKFAEFQTLANRHALQFALVQTDFLSLARAELGITGDPIDQLEVQAMFERAQAALRRLKQAVGLPEYGED